MFALVLLRKHKGVFIFRTERERAMEEIKKKLFAAEDAHKEWFEE